MNLTSTTDYGLELKRGDSGEEIMLMRGSVLSRGQC